MDFMYQMNNSYNVLNMNQNIKKSLDVWSVAKTISKEYIIDNTKERG